MNDTPEPIVRDRSEAPTQLKKIELIAPEEIQAAIEQSVGDSFGLATEDVAISACRLLGFARVSEDMRMAVEELRDDLISKGRLAQRGQDDRPKPSGKVTHLVLKPPSRNLRGRFRRGLLALRDHNLRQLVGAAQRDHRVPKASK